MPVVVCYHQTLSAGLGQDVHALMTPLSHHQLLPRHVSAHPAVAGDTTAVALQMAGCHLNQGAATAAVGGSVLLAEEESTMCLRDQLIHSRCTEQRLVTIQGAAGLWNIECVMDYVRLVSKYDHASSCSVGLRCRISCMIVLTDCARDYAKLCSCINKSCVQHHVNDIT